MQELALPYILDPAHLQLDAVVSFVVVVLITLTINAEAQAFMSTILGDSRIGAKDRFHFNFMLHLDICGALCYLAGGFGWPRPMAVDESKFKYPRLYTFLTRLAGPVANLLLAGIIASIVAIMKIVEFNPLVFLMLLGVNVTTAVYNLIPLPPLAGGALISALMPKQMDKIKWLFNLIGPYLIVAIIILERIKGELPFKGYLDPLVVAVFNFIKG